MSTPKIHIKTTNARSIVTIDGQEIKGIRDIYFEHKPLEVPILTLKIVALDTTFDGHFLPRLPEPLNKYYERIPLSPENFSISGKEEEIEDLRKAYAEYIEKREAYEAKEKELFR